MLSKPQQRRFQQAKPGNLRSQACVTLNQTDGAQERQLLQFDLGASGFEVLLELVRQAGDQLLIILFLLVSSGIGLLQVILGPGQKTPGIAQFFFEAVDASGEGFELAILGQFGM